MRVVKGVRFLLSAVLATLAVLSLQGCILAAGAAAGGAGGYVAAKQGYEVQSPITKGPAGGTAPETAPPVSAEPLPPAQ